MSYVICIPCSCTSCTYAKHTIDSCIKNFSFSFVTEYKSSVILKKHQADIVQVLPVQSPELLEILCAEEIITAETKSEVKDKGSEALVQAIVQSVEENPDKLHSVVKFLLLREESVTLGKRIKKQIGNQVNI